MSKFYYLAIVLMFLGFSVSGQNRFLPFTKELKESDASEQTILPRKEVKDLGDGFIEVTYYFEGAEVIDRAHDDDLYNFLQIKGFGQLGQVGAPALPMRNDQFVMSKGTSPALELVDTTFEDYPNFMVHPALEPAQDTQGAPDPVFEKDAAVYHSNAFFPTNQVKISMDQIMSDIRIASVRVCPVQFNPVSKTLRVYSKLVYRFYKGVGTTASSLDQRTLDVLKTEVVNPSQLVDDEGSLTDEVDPDAHDYIIITHQDFDEAANKLAAWKSSLGYKVDVVSKAAWTANNVREEIAERYRTWNPKPKYYVIIGDVEFVPSMPFHTSRGEEFFSDLYYSCMDGDDDFTPDMARGRLSVETVAQANIVVDKIIKYEKDPVEDADFYQNGVNCAQFQDVQAGNPRDGFAARRFCHTSEDIRNYITGQGYDVERIYYTNPANNPTNFNNGYYSNGEAIAPELLRANGFQWDGDADDVAREINDGKFYVFHRDHGYAGGSGWAHPEFVTNQMDRLHNGDKLPVVFSINCHTGEFSLDECFAEKFLRLEDAGAVAVFGASYYSYSGPNDGLSIGLVEAIWPNPGILPSFGAGSRAVNAPAQGFANATTTLGDVLNLGLLRMNQTWAPNNDYLLYTYRLFHLFGDPAMRMWTQQPTTIHATLPEEVTHGMNRLVVSDVDCEDALVTITVDGKLLSKSTVRDGRAELVFDEIQVGDHAMVTVSKSNCRPVYKEYSLPKIAPITKFSIKESFPIKGAHAIVHFISECEGNVVKYQWNFGSADIEFLEGTSAMSQNPVVKYTKQGMFDVTLNASNKYGDNDFTIANAVEYIEGLIPVTCTNVAHYPSDKYDFGIYKVQVGDLSITSKSTFAEGGYVDQTSKGVFEANGSNVTVSVTLGNDHPEAVGIFIDKNNDGELTNAELVATSKAINGEQDVQFNVDDSFLKGKKVRMRIVSDYDRYDITTACQELYYGQAEDFTIIFGSQAGSVKIVSAPTVSENSASFELKIANIDATNINEQGVVISKSSTPTILDAKYTTSNPNVLISTVVVAGLDFNATYYARAYVMDGSAVTYSDEFVFRTEEKRGILASTTCTNSTTNTAGDYGFGIYQVKIGDMQVDSKGSFEEHGYVDQTNKGIFEVNTSSVECEVTVGSSYSENIAIYIDKNNDGALSNDELVVSSKNIQGSCKLSFDIDNSYTLNTVIRMRVISEYNTYDITTPCQDLYYGQAEDFAVRFSSVAPAVQTLSSPVVHEDFVEIGMEVSGIMLSDILEQGVAVATNVNPTVSDLKYSVSAPTSLVNTIEIRDLTVNTFYYARAYMTTSTGTVYGNVVTFKTKEVIQIAAASCTNVQKFTTGDFGFGIYKVQYGNNQVISSGGLEEGGYVDNATGSSWTVDATTMELDITVGSSYHENLGIFIDKDNNGELTGDELVLKADNIIGENHLSFEVGNDFVRNYPLRMRIVSDYNGYEITSPCQDLAYGQAEDYSVTFTSKATEVNNWNAFNTDMDQLDVEVKGSASVNKVMIFPNPVVTEMHIILTDKPKTRIAAELINVAGHTVEQFYLNERDNLVSVNLPSGIYFVRVLLNNKVVLKKVVVK
ncbi:C25 family cysteine peptidase [Prolixibacteraceae bacterium]|nr:C25 family cysteine peptidase [Prolixibacteraceae bacterium]